MQDNYPHEFDEQFIGQAWLKMRQMLDKEMPVQPKRRAAWWVWLLAGLFLIAVMSGGAYYLFKNSPPQAMPAPTAGIEAQTGNTQATPPQELNGGAAIREETQEAPHATLNSGLTANGEFSNTNAVAQNASAAAASNIPPETIPREGTVGKQAQKVAEESIAKLTNEAQKTAPAPSGKESGQAVAPERESIALATLPMTRALVLPLSGKADEEGLLALSGYSQGRTFRLAVEGGAYFLGHSAPDGLSAGLAFEVRPHGSRFYLRSGAFYRPYQLKAATPERNFQLELANRISVLSASSDITAARYVQVPLTAGYQWTPRLAFEAGLQAGVLLSSQAISKWSLSNQSSSSGDPKQEDNTIYEFRENSGNDELKATSFDIIAGLAYRPAPRTSLRISYQYGLANILNTSLEENYIRGLQLSLAFYITK